MSCARNELRESVGINYEYYSNDETEIGSSEFSEDSFEEYDFPSPDDIKPIEDDTLYKCIKCLELKRTNLKNKPFVCENCILTEDDIKIISSCIEDNELKKIADKMFFTII